MAETNTNEDYDSKISQIENNSSPETLEMKAYAPSGEMPVVEETGSTSMQNNICEIRPRTIRIRRRFGSGKIEMKELHDPPADAPTEEVNEHPDLLNKTGEIRPKIARIRRRFGSGKIEMKELHDPAADAPAEEVNENPDLLNKTGEIKPGNPDASKNSIPEEMQIKPLKPPVGILIGEGGTGKTTLLSKVCEIKSEAGLSHVSKAENIFKNLNKVGESPFELIDTPGTDRFNFSQENAILLREALIDCEVSTIFVFIKYDARHVRMAESLFKVTALVQQYENKVVVVITHWELSSNPNEEKERIKTMLGQDIAGIIFSSKDDNPAEIANWISSFLEKMPREKLEIPDKEFFLNFRFSEDSLEVEGQVEEKEKTQNIEKKSRLDSGFGNWTCSLI